MSQPEILQRSHVCLDYYYTNDQGVERANITGKLVRDNRMYYDHEDRWLRYDSCNKGHPFIASRVHARLLQQADEKGDVHNCEDCKHKLVCLIDPFTERTFEPV